MHTVWSKPDTLTPISSELLGNGQTRLVFKAKYEVLIKARPRVGQIIVGAGDSRVSRVHIKPTDAGTAGNAMMTVTHGPTDLN